MSTSEDNDYKGDKDNAMLGSTHTKTLQDLLKNQKLGDSTNSKTLNRSGIEFPALSEPFIKPVNDVFKVKYSDVLEPVEFKPVNDVYISKSGGESDNAMLASTHTPILRDQIQSYRNYSPSYSSSKNDSRSSASVWVVVIALIVGMGIIGYFVFF